ncbi:MAG TPA: hypothetical protein VFN09_12465 [Rhodanobacteraceae bacterium]|nr:hypothetical protein [Rhodanobacteraceae bacterium]
MSTNAEVLLALRAPGADWLATLITALDESRRDPEFSPQLRSIFAELAAMDAIPDSIITAAHRRTSEFTERLTEEAARIDAAPMVTERPRLTLVAG